MSNLIPSRERTPLDPALALEHFLATFGVNTACDIGPHLTCTEAEAFADLLAAHGQHDAADWLRRGHVEDDDDGDMDHNTGEYPADEDDETPQGPVILGQAERVKFHEARRHFEAGGEVLVSEDGHQPTRTVTNLTTTHTNATTTWDHLAEQVRMWRGRYPNQRFYIVRRTPEGA